METNKTNNGCKSQNNNEMQGTGISINAKDLTERGKLVFSPYKATKLEIEISDNTINIQAGNVSIKIPLSNEQAVNPILQLPTLKIDPYDVVARKLYIKECDLDAIPNIQPRRKEGKLDNINDY